MALLGRHTKIINLEQHKENFIADHENGRPITAPRYAPKNADESRPASRLKFFNQLVASVDSMKFTGNSANFNKLMHKFDEEISKIMFPLEQNS